MSDDRELLKLAAKAAGLDYHATSDDGTKHVHDGRGYWNPLTDDGDALRLAVRCRLTIHLAECNDPIEVARWANAPMTWDYVKEPREDDPYAATRRAIVRSAAEIGRTM